MLILIMPLLDQLLHRDVPELRGLEGLDPTHQSYERKPYVPDQHHAGASKKLWPRRHASGYPSRGTLYL